MGTAELLGASHTVWTPSRCWPSKMHLPLLKSFARVRVDNPQESSSTHAATWELARSGQILTGRVPWWKGDTLQARRAAAGGQAVPSAS